MELNLRNELLDLNYKNPTISKLAGDASSREYYRFTHLNGSAILMQREVFDPKVDPFCLCQKFFSNFVKVPKILNILGHKGLMVLEDLGDINLQNVNTDNKKPYYLKVIDDLLLFQNKTLNTEAKYPLTISFTFEKFYSELLMTSTYYLDKFRNKTNTNNIMLPFYEELVSQMLKQKTMLLHRDFHSKNIMIKNEQIYYIDFQDARLGPYTYDLASLILDPYTRISDALSKAMLLRYHKHIAHENYEDFYYNYLLSYVQRLIKILGTFTFQKFEKSNDSYLKYIPLVISKINDVKKYFPKWKGVLEEFTD